MAIYTYQDFEKAMNDNGLQAGFSDADLRLAKLNPDAGMSILNYKLDYKKATTPEMKALANAGAENVRSQYGGYTAGTSGIGFNMQQPTISSFNAGQVPEYQNRYDDQIQGMMADLLDRKPFEYDAASDPIYSNYRKQYAREGQRATQDALGAAAAATGGIPSSYAVTAASQAGDYYAAQAADRIQDLYNLAYNRYLNDNNMVRENLAAAQAGEQADYQKYLAQTDQYNAGRTFEYSRLLDQLNAQQQAEQNELSKALAAAELGDYSLLAKLGINGSNNPAEWEKLFNIAKLKAEYGDFSAMRNLGVNVGGTSAAAAPAASSGGTSSSGGSKSSSGTRSYSSASSATTPAATTQTGPTQADLDALKAYTKGKINSVTNSFTNALRSLAK